MEGKQPSKKLTYSAVAVLSIFALTLVFLLFFNKREKVTGIDSYSQDNFSALLNGIKQIKRLWIEGGDVKDWKKGKYNCPEVLGSWENVGQSYLRCNPGFLHCYFSEGRNLKVESDSGETYLLRLANKFRDSSGRSYRYRVVTRSTSGYPNVPSYGVMLSLEDASDPNLKMDFILDDLCHETYIPQRNYGAGEFSEKRNFKDWRFDTHGRNVVIDKFQVTNRDIFDWVRFGNGPKNLIPPIKNKVLAAPATHLRPDQMEGFCRFQGKVLAQAPYYDAATFHPGDLKDAFSKQNPRGPYPWGRKYKNNFLFLASYKGNYEMKEKDCKKAYTLECMKLAPYIHYDRSSTSWIGLFNILGGYPEYVVNHIKPKENLVASSFYQRANSPWHRLGKKAHWDAKGFGPKNFTHDLFVKVDQNYEVSFRCQREVYAKK